MSKIQRFEDLIAWQKARELCQLINNYSHKESFSKDYKLVSQIKASSGSTMDNIAEGFERGGNKEFGQFLWISKGSAGEVRSQLYRALDNQYIDENEFNTAYKIADDIGKLNRGLINHLKESEIKGFKFK